jgi:hypothetical protein
MTSPVILYGGELDSKSFEFMRVPLDGLCRSIRRIPNFLMGVVCLDGLPASVQSRLAYELAVRIAERTGRTTAFIDGTHGSPADDCSTDETSVTRWSWERIDQEYPAGSPEYKQSLKELSALPVLRRQHGITILDLDGLDSFRLERLGRLCDGVVVLIPPSHGTKFGMQRMARTLSKHQQNGICFLGAWVLDRQS